MSWSSLLGAGPWAAFLGLCSTIVFWFATDRVISAREYNRREAELREAHERELATERRISDYHEKRADTEAGAREAAQATLMRLTSELPEALRQLKAGQT